MEDYHRKHRHTTDHRKTIRKTTRKTRTKTTRVEYTKNILTSHSKHDVDHETLGQHSKDITEHFINFQ